MSTERGVVGLDLSRYDAYPDHPLCGVPAEILQAARAAMQEAVEAKDVHPDMADSIADMVVMDLLPWITPPENSPQVVAGMCAEAAREMKREGQYRSWTQRWAKTSATICDELARRCEAILKPRRDLGQLGQRRGH